MSAPVTGVGTRLDPAAAQATFRAVLDALSRPGTVTRLPRAGLEIAPAGLLPVLALADLGTPVCVLDTDTDTGPGGRWSDLLATATSAPQVGLRAARLVAALRPVTVDELRGLRPGTAHAPEDAALVTVAVPSLAGGPEYLLAGPGTRPGSRLAPTGLPASWPRARDAAAFPAGADLLFTDPDGRLVGLPRSARVADVDLRQGS